MVLFWWSLRFLAICVLGFLTVRELTGDRFMPVRLFTYFHPWFLIPLFAALAVALLHKKGGTALLLAIPFCLVLLPYLHLFLPRAPSPAPPAGAFTVMSFNIWSKNERVAEIAALVREENPDILLLQEVEPALYPDILRALENLHPGGMLHSAFAAELMQAVVSRYPLAGCETFRAKGQAQRIRVRTAGGDVTIFNVHPLRRGNWTHRHLRLSRLLTEEVLRVEGPVIVAGDFNTTEGSEIYRLLSAHLRNAHREGGRGFGFTYPATGVLRLGPVPLPSAVRIDHIFVNPGLKVHRAATLPRSAGSDHRPVVAELYLASPGRESSPALQAPGGEVTCTEKDVQVKVQVKD